MDFFSDDETRGFVPRVFRAYISGGKSAERIRARAREPKYIKMSIICTLKFNSKKSVCNYFFDLCIFCSPIFPLLNETMPIAGRSLQFEIVA